MARFSHIPKSMNDFETERTVVEGFAPLALQYEEPSTRVSDALAGAWMRAVSAGNEGLADALATIIRRSR